MKITPDTDAPQQLCNEHGYMHCEEYLKDGYFHVVFLLIDGEQAKAIITESGVRVDFRSGNTVHTNLNPQQIFSKEKIEWNDIEFILKRLEDIGLEGKSYSSEEMAEFYKKWQDLHPE